MFSRGFWKLCCIQTVHTVHYHTKNKYFFSNSRLLLGVQEAMLYLSCDLIVIISWGILAFILKHLHNENKSYEFCLLIVVFSQGFIHLVYNQRVIALYNTKPHNNSIILCCIQIIVFSKGVKKEICRMSAFQRFINFTNLRNKEVENLTNILYLLLFSWCQERP